MSTVPTARPARSAARRLGRPSIQRRPLTLVPPYRRSRAPRAPFVVVVVVLLAGGLIALLMLNTTLAQDSFRLSDLRARTAELGAREEALEKEVADLAAPQRLADAARRLGMMPTEEPLFLRTPDGEVVGGSEDDR